METKKPEKTIKHGRVRAAVWKNDSKNGPFLNVTFSRVYKDGETFKESGSFGVTDLENLLCCAVEALLSLESQEAKPG
jgi:hypothetical protein